MCGYVSNPPIRLRGYVLKVRAKLYIYRTV